jgi:hypothetical protein
MDNRQQLQDELNRTKDAITLLRFYGELMAVKPPVTEMQSTEGLNVLKSAVEKIFSICEELSSFKAADADPPPAPATLRPEESKP